MEASRRNPFTEPGRVKGVNSQETVTDRGHRRSHGSTRSRETTKVRSPLLDTTELAEAAEGRRGRRGACGAARHDDVSLGGFRFEGGREGPGGALARAGPGGSERYEQLTRPVLVVSLGSSPARAAGRRPAPPGPIPAAAARLGAFGDLPRLRRVPS